MTSVISKSSAETMSASTAFSYAQAAKGQVISQPAPPLSGSAAPSTKDDALSSTASGTAPPSQVATSEMSESVKSLHTESEVGRQNTDLDVASVGESASSGLATDQSINTPRADDGADADSQRVPGEKFTRTSTQSSRSGDGADGKKGRKGKKSRNSEKDSEAEQAQEKEKEEVKIALVEASIPSVNIWAQRAATLAAKKPASATPASAATMPDSRGASEDLKAQEPKKKPAFIETSEAQNGAALANSRPPRRSGDASRFGNDSASRRAPRGSRAFDSEKLNLPPVEDATSWPTPVSAADDEGKRTVPEKERTEVQVQEEAPPAKLEKKKWVVMPFVPTVSFNTQIQQPRRQTRDGGRPNGSTSRRGGQAPSANAAGEKSPAATGSQGESPEAARDTAPPSRANSLPPQASKRASMDVAYVRDQRKPSAPSSNPRANGADYPASTTPSENAKSQRSEPGQGNGEQYPRRSDQPFRSGELGKEGSFPAGKEQRSNRGGYRQPRGGSHNSAQGHPQQSGYAQGGQGFQKYGGPLSPPPNQTSFPPNYGAPLTKNGRPRPQSIPNGYMSKVSQNGADGAPKMHPLQTSGLDYNGYHMGPYSAPFQPYQQPYYDPSVVHVLMIQVEYYLSVENLCKDMFLRKKMDSQGFVFFELIAGFKRLQEFSGGDVNMVRVACETSEHLDFVLGDDNVERLRLRDGWHNFILPVEQRDEEARSPGPQGYMYRSRHSRHLYPGAMMAPGGYPTTSPTMYRSAGFPPNGIDQAFGGYPNGGAYHPGMNGVEVNGQSYPVESQLSAEVPAFAPGGMLGGNDGTLRLEDATTMSDDQVANLMLVSHANNAEATPSASNGTYDTSVAGPTQGAPEGAARVNGNTAGSEHGSAAVTSPQTSSLEVTSASDAPQTMGPGENIQENYTAIRSRALEHRQRANPGDLPADMKELYRFWGFFLLDNFNLTVYQDFRALALEDASAKIPLTYGLDKLVRYYEDVLVRGKGRVWGARDIYPEEFNAHYDEAKTIASRNGNANGEVQA